MVTKTGLSTVGVGVSPLRPRVCADDWEPGSGGRLLRPPRITALSAIDR